MHLLLQNQDVVVDAKTIFENDLVLSATRDQGLSAPSVIDVFFFFCRLVQFQEQVAELTDIRSSRQLMLYEGAQFEMDAFVPVHDYPHTSPEHPLLLLSTDMSDFQSISIPHTCKFLMLY